MGVVSVRLDDEDEAWLRRHGLKPGAFARAAVHEAIRREEILQAGQRLAKGRVKLPKESAELIRDDRGR
jgi:hypothetical protein